MESDLSLGEKILGASYKAEKMNKKLRAVSYYKRRLDKIKKNLKSEIKKGKTPEEAICDYVSEVYDGARNARFRNKKKNYISLLDALESENLNCGSCASLHLMLAEKLDFDLFEKCCVGVLPEHIIVARKNIGADGWYLMEYGLPVIDAYYIELYGKTPELKPKEAVISSILFNQGDLLAEKGEYKDSIKYFDEAIKIDSEDASTWNNKGASYYNLKNYREAIKCYDRALEIDPESAMVQENRKEVFCKLKNK